MSVKKKNIAVIGCGSWGRNLIRNFCEMGVLAGVSAHHIETAEAIGEQLGIPVMSHEEIIENSDITGVVVATPSDSHFNVASQMLRAGKHVFVEKPMVTTIEEGEKLKEIAKQNKRILMVGHLLLYHPAFLKVKEIVASGKLGEISHIYSSRLNLGKILSHENIIWDCAPHDISMVLELFEEMPEAVTATGASYVVDPHEDKAHVSLKFPKNRNAVIHVSRLHPFKEQRLIVIGKKGMLVFDDTLPWDKKITHYDTFAQNHEQGVHLNRGETNHIPLTVSEPLRLECEHFVDCIERNLQPRTTADDALNGMRILEATDASLKEGKTIHLKG